MKGSIVAAGEGDAQAALRARALGRLLLIHEGVEVAGPGAPGRAVVTTRSVRKAATNTKRGKPARVGPC